MSDSIDITGVDRAYLISSLCNSTNPLGLGELQGSLTLFPNDIEEMFGEDLNSPMLIMDYVAGKPIKVTLDGNKLLRADLYDRDSSPGLCQKIVDYCKEHPRLK